MDIVFKTTATTTTKITTITTTTVIVMERYFTQPTQGEVDMG